MSSRVVREFCATGFLVFLCVAGAPVGMALSMVEASDLAGAGFTAAMPGADVFSPILIKGKETPDKEESTRADAAIPMAKELWNYLRAGINYVESSGREYAPRFVHPGGKAYGALALTPIAIKDVIIHYKEFADYSVDNVLSDKLLYERAALFYADLLLRRYLKISYDGMSRRDLFMVLQRAWFLGPTLYKKGTVSVPNSRERNSMDFLAKSDTLSTAGV